MSYEKTPEESHMERAPPPFHFSPHSLHFSIPPSIPWDRLESLRKDKEGKPIWHNHVLTEYKLEIILFGVQTRRFWQLCKHVPESKAVESESIWDSNGHEV